MTKYYVDASRADDTGAGTSWGVAKKTFTAGLALCTSGDVLLRDVNTSEEVGATTTWTIPAGVTVISVDKNSSDAYTAMAASAWLGNSTTSYSVTVNIGNAVAMYGITFRTAGTSSVSMLLDPADGAQYQANDLYIWHGTTSTAQFIGLTSTADRQSFVTLVNPTFRFGATAQYVRAPANIEIYGGSVSAAGSAPTSFWNTALNDPGGSQARFHGFDATHVNTTLIRDNTSISSDFYFTQCKLPSGFIAMATQTNLNKSSGRVWIADCSDNAGTPVRGIWGYYDSLGSVVKETGIYYTTGAAGWSWKIVGTANSNFHNPFVTPWIDFWNTANASVTPRVEVLRDGSTTAYTDAQVWGEFAVKSTSGSDQAGLPLTDRQDLMTWAAGTAGASQATGAGAGSWSGESGTAWFGKVDSGAAVTPAEDGVLRGRVAVVGSITVYVDPEIRTA